MSNIDKYSESIFEDIKHLTEDGIEFWYGRELQVVLEYKEWRNFKNVIEKASQLISSGLSSGRVVETSKFIELPFGAIREIIDYKLDKDAVKLVNSLAYNKLKKAPTSRNETMILSMVEKYCIAKGIEFEFQYPLEEYRFDCLIGNKLLIEFDEQHHINKNQRLIDKRKDKMAKKQGYDIIRFNILHDIVDIILVIEEYEQIFFFDCNFENINDDSLTSIQQYMNPLIIKKNKNYENEGFKGLYGGLHKNEIYLKKGIDRKEILENYMGSTELAANLFRATQTDEKLRREQIKGKEKANKTHYEVGSKVRQTIKELGGTMPEDLPTPGKSIKQIEKEKKKKELETD